MAANYLSEALISYAIYGHPDLPVVYVNNPKAACSSIKTSLWRYYDELHQTNTLPKDRTVHIKTGKPFLESVLAASNEVQSSILEKPFFSVVRNPFSRIAGAYKQKLLGGDPHVLKWFCEAYFLRADLIDENSLPFSDFLKIVGLQDPLTLNPHFRTQSINLMLPFTAFDFIGRLEDMRSVREYLEHHGVVMTAANVSDDASGAHQEQLHAFYDQGCRALVEHIYQDDFMAFGYDPNEGIFSASRETKVHAGAGIKELVSDPANIATLALAPELKSYYRFVQENDIGKKLEIVESTDHFHKNRGILREMGAFLALHKKGRIYSEIQEQLFRCTFGHLDLITDRRIIDKDRLPKRMRL